jgi:hypothetical protein
MSNLTYIGSTVGAPLEPDEAGLAPRQKAYVSVGVRQPTREFPDAWQQFNSALRLGLANLGFPQTEVIDEFMPPATACPAFVVVAPGIVVRADEYEERYAGIDLEGLRGRMTPAVFKAFVRHLGSIRGTPDLDVDEIATIPERD